MLSKDAVSVSRIHFTSKNVHKIHSGKKKNIKNDVFVILSAFCLPHMICAMMKIKATNKRNICQLSIQVCGFSVFCEDSLIRSVFYRVPGVRKRLVRERHEDDGEEVIELACVFGIHSGLKISSPDGVRPKVRAPIQ